MLDAQLDYYTLLLDYVDAVFDLRITELRLARTTGELWIASDSDNAWIDRIFGGAARPLLNEEGVLGVLCIARSGRCAEQVAEPARARETGQGLAFKGLPT